MDTIRVLLALRSELLTDIVASQIEGEPDLQVVGVATDPVDILVEVARTQADVVISEWPDPEIIPGICTHLLTEYPGLVFLGVSRDSDQAIAARQTITKTTVESAGINELLSEIRRGKAEVELVEC